MESLIDLAAIAAVGVVAAAATTGLVWGMARLRLARMAHELQVLDWGLCNLRTDLEEREELLHAFMTHTSDVAIRLDAAGKAVSVSPSCQAVLGYAPADLIGHGSFDLIHPDEAPGLRDTVAAGIAWDGQARVRRRDGRLLVMATRLRMLPHRLGVLMILTDIARQVPPDRQWVGIRAQAAGRGRMDPITGLPGRACFMELGLHQSAPVALLLVNLDGFAATNASHGFPVGDIVLRATGERLRAEAAEASLIARLGDDEFAVVLQMSDGETAVAARARDILRAVAASIRMGGLTLEPSASIGIAISPRDGTDAAALLHRAAAALEHAKQTGGGHYRFFEARMNDSDVDFGGLLQPHLRPMACLQPMPV